MLTSGGTRRYLSGSSGARCEPTGWAAAKREWETEALELEDAIRRYLT
jgi:hypothetical protein